jgi:hypothetical protein
VLLVTWQQEIKSAAMETWPSSQHPFEAEVELRITHYSETRKADMDNLTKPIQDALQGIAYPHDRKVEVTGNWRNIDGSFYVRYMSPPLASAFSDGREFVHVRLWVAAANKDLG